MRDCGVLSQGSFRGAGRRNYSGEYSRICRAGGPASWDRAVGSASSPGTRLLTMIHVVTQAER